jgi:hypothetical protein
MQRRRTWVSYTLPSLGICDSFPWFTAPSHDHASGIPWGCCGACLHSSLAAYMLPELVLETVIGMTYLQAYQCKWKRTSTCVSSSTG